MNPPQVIEKLKRLSQPVRKEGMKKFRVNTDKALGVSIPDLRRLAKRMGKDHDLALRLWETEIHQARIPASIIDLPDKVTREQMDKWAEDFNSWDLCDQCLNNLFCYTTHAHAKAVEWPEREVESVKRAGI